MGATATEAKAAAKSGDAHWQDKMRKMRARKLPERTLEFYDEELRQERDRLFIELSAAEADDKVTAARKAEAKASHEAAVAAYDDSVVSFSFRAIPRPQYEALLNLHGPTEEQEQEGMSYNEQTFAPALVQACSLDPMTLEEARELLGSVDPDSGEPVSTDLTLNMGEALAMFRTCTQLCERMRVDVGKGSQPTPG